MLVKKNTKKLPAIGDQNLQAAASVAFRIQPDAGDPPTYNSSILPCRHVRLRMDPAGKEEVAFAETATGNPRLNSDPRLFGDFELDRPAGLPLDDDCAIADCTRERNVVNMKSYKVAAP
jgi:hypothetical protein